MVERISKKSQNGIIKKTSSEHIIAFDDDLHEDDMHGTVGEIIMSLVPQNGNDDEGSPTKRLRRKVEIKVDPSEESSSEYDPLTPKKRKIKEPKAGGSADLVCNLGCGKQFESQAGRDYHVDNQVCLRKRKSAPAPASIPEKMECSSCGKVFISLAGWNYHKEKVCK